MALSRHHKAWLLDHPIRSAEWLQRMIAEGFEVHHVDGDHSNNHPKNLILVEVQDHRALHGIFRLRDRHLQRMIEMKRAKIDYQSRPLTDAERRKREWARKSAVARSKSCSPEQRSLIAKRAAQIRWSNANTGTE